MGARTTPCSRVRSLACPTESFSSTGYQTEFLFNPNGTPLSTPEVRNEPLFVGVDGDNLNVAGTNEFTPFSGTSAAA